MIGLHEGDCRPILKGLEDATVDCCVTSPPYFNMRDYGVKGQIGLEKTIASHVRVMVNVFREVRRVLKPQGTLWLNYGDSYAEGGRGGHRKSAGFHAHKSREGDLAGKRKRLVKGGVKPKDLIGMPWRIALALQADGWWLRSCIVWEKPSCMPESAKDRPTSSHEYIFLLAKKRRYYYDGAAIAEPRAADTNARYLRARGQDYAPPGQRAQAGPVVGARDNQVGVWGAGEGRKFGKAGVIEHNGAGPKDLLRDDMGLKPSTRFGRGAGWREADKGDRKTFRGGGKYAHNESFNPNGKVNQQNGNRDVEGETRNARTVWRISAAPTSVPHFATFPPELARRCILAGCPPKGTVLDPFSGWGTVGLEADRNQRNAILIELNPAYMKLARDRIHDDAPLLSNFQEAGA